jgi:hypothetical protein
VCNGSDTLSVHGANDPALAGTPCLRLKVVRRLGLGRGLFKRPKALGGHPEKLEARRKSPAGLEGGECLSEDVVRTIGVGVEALPRAPQASASKKSDAVLRESELVLGGGLGPFRGGPGPLPRRETPDFGWGEGDGSLLSFAKGQMSLVVVDSVCSGGSILASAVGAGSGASWPQTAMGSPMAKLDLLV